MNDRDHELRDYSRLAELLRSRRESLGYSRPDVAMRTGITESTLESYERVSKPAAPKPRPLLLLASLYGISYPELTAAIGVPSWAEKDGGVTPAKAMTNERVKRGLTVEQMATELGRTPKEIAAFERGDVEVTAVVLAQATSLPEPPPG